MGPALEKRTVLDQLAPTTAARFPSPVARYPLPVARRPPPATRHRSPVSRQPTAFHLHPPSAPRGGRSSDSGVVPRRGLKLFAVGTERFSMALGAELDGGGGWRATGDGKRAAVVGASWSRTVLFSSAGPTEATQQKSFAPDRHGMPPSPAAIGSEGQERPKDQRPLPWRPDSDLNPSGRRAATA